MYNDGWMADGFMPEYEMAFDDGLDSMYAMRYDPRYYDFDGRYFRDFRFRRPYPMHRFRPYHHHRRRYW